MTEAPAQGLRFLYVHPVSLPSPEANVVQVAESARALAVLGHEVFLIVPRVKRDSVTEALARVGVTPHERLFVIEEPAIRLKNSNRFSSLGVRAALFWYLRSLVKRGRTVILFRSLRDSRLARFLLSAGRWLRVPVVYEAHKIYAEKRAEQGFTTGTLARVHRLERRALGRSAGVIASHPLLEKEIRRDLRKTAPMATIPNGVPMLDAGRGDDPSRPFDVVYAGSLFPWKGVDQCLDAVARVPGCRFALVGGNPKDRLEVLKLRAQELGIADRVTFSGHVDRASVFATIARSKLALVPLSRDSGEGERYTCPLKLLEAMMLGTPVIAADTEALRSFVTPDRDAVLVPPDDVPALAGAITALLGDEPRRRKLATTARDVALGLGYAKRAERITEFARSLL